MYALAAGNVLADVEVEASGQVRVRCEFDDSSFAAADVVRHYSYLRTRINVNTEINENVHAFVQFQDSRR